MRSNQNPDNLPQSFEELQHWNKWNWKNGLVIHDLRCFFYLIRTQENWEPKNFSMFQQLFSATGGVTFCTVSLWACWVTWQATHGNLHQMESERHLNSCTSMYRMYIYIYLLYVYTIGVLFYKYIYINIYLKIWLSVHLYTYTSILHLDIYNYTIWFSMRIRTRLKSKKVRTSGISPDSHPAMQMASSVDNPSAPNQPQFLQRIHITPLAETPTNCLKKYLAE